MEEGICKGIVTTMVISNTEAAEKVTAREIVLEVNREKEGSKETRLMTFWLATRN